MLRKRACMHTLFVLYISVGSLLACMAPVCIYMKGEREKLFLRSSHAS